MSAVKSNAIIDLVLGVLILMLPMAFVMIPNGSLLVLPVLIISVLGLFFNRDRSELNKNEKYFVFAFIFYFATVATNLWWFDGYLRDLDTPSRLLLVLPIFFFIRKSSVRIDWFVWGVVIASLIVGVDQIASTFGKVDLYSFHENSGIMTLFSSIFGLTSLLFICNEKGKIINSLFFLAAMLGIVASFLLGGRGVWIAAIASLFIIGLINPMGWEKGSRLLPIGLFFCVFIVAYLTPQTGVKTRLTQATNNVIQWLESGNANTSSGARLEMWKASFEVIKENPIIGVGEGNYAKHQQKLIDQGRVDKFVGRFSHPHSEYITSLVEQGMIGLLAFVMVLFTPVMFFIKIIKHNSFSYQERALTASGMLISLHFLFYSFTSGVFDHQVTALFYAIFMAIILGLIKSNSRIKV